MPKPAQIPTLMAVSTDNTRDKTYLQTQVDADPDFMIEGQLFWNEPLNRVFVKDNADVVQDLEVKNNQLVGDTLSNIRQVLVDANLESITNLAEVQTILINLRNELITYESNKE